MALALPKQKHEIKKGAHPDAIDTEAFGSDAQRAILTRRQQEINTWKQTNGADAEPTDYKEIPDIEIYDHRDQTRPAPCGSPNTNLPLANFQTMVENDGFPKRAATWNFVVMANAPDVVRIVDWTACQAEGGRLERQAMQKQHAGKAQEATQLRAQAKACKKTGHTSLLSGPEYAHALEHRDIKYSGSFIVNANGKLTEVRNDSGHMLPAKFWLRAFANHWAGDDIPIHGTGNLAAKMAIRNRLIMDSFDYDDGMNQQDLYGFRHKDISHHNYKHHGRDHGLQSQQGIAIDNGMAHEVIVYTPNLDGQSHHDTVSDRYGYDHEAGGYNYIHNESQYLVLFGLITIIVLGICCLFVILSSIFSFAAGKFHERTKYHKPRGKHVYDQIHVITEDQI